MSDHKQFDLDDFIDDQDALLDVFNQDGNFVDDTQLELEFDYGLDD